MSNNETINNELGEAVKRNDIETAGKLLERGADPNSEVRFRHRIGIEDINLPMLTYAITETKSKEMARLLLEYGADINTRRIDPDDSQGKTTSGVLCDAIKKQR